MLTLNVVTQSKIHYHIAIKMHKLANENRARIFTKSKNTNGYIFIIAKNDNNIKFRLCDKDSISQKFLFVNIFFAYCTNIVKKTEKRYNKPPKFWNNKGKCATDVEILN